MLVVDDDPDARELIRTVLAYAGAFVTLSASAREALALLERLTPDVLVSDIEMPEETGYWLLREAHARRGGRAETMAAVAITAYGDAHGPDRTLAAGFDVHLRKPLDPWELCRVVAALSRRR